ncbi:neprilysin-1-like [Haematobia irritans]|uniref:neprilysin-1-like n=1 Tax=Haematobia irritans TaxID=7368 RepID=UPI003F4FAD14
MEIKNWHLIFLLSVWPLKTSTLTIDELNSNHSDEIVRQTKAEEILKYFNKTADPCEDFFQFSCGNYGLYHATNTSISQLDIIEEALKRKLQHVLEMDARPEDTNADSKLKLFYRSCLKAPAVMNRETLANLIKEFGEMPLMAGKNWQEDQFDWRETVAKIFSKTKRAIIFDYTIVSPDYRTKREKNHLVLNQATFGLKHPLYYLDPSIPGELEKYRKRIADNLFHTFGASEDMARRTANEILEVEIALAQGMLDEKFNQNDYEDVYFKDSSFSHGVILGLISLLDKTDVIIKDMIKNSMGFLPPEATVQMRYVKNTLEVLRKTPKRQLANYIFYNFISNFIIQLRDGIDTREKYCVETTKEMFYKNSMNLVYRHYFNNHSKEIVDDMWQQIKGSFENILLSDRLSWIEDATRNQAIEKLKSMNLKFLTFEQEHLRENVTDLHLQLDNFVYNLNETFVLQAQQFKMKFHQPGESSIITYLLPFYTLWENTVEIPVSILQPFYAWSLRYPHAYNYASLGVFLAHEMLHGFDTLGQWFNTQGLPVRWWDSESLTRFDIRLDCIRDQYGEYRFGDRRLEMNVHNENIADNGAIRVAYEAYLKWLESNPLAIEGEGFPGLNFTNRQLFFISYAQGFCAATKPEYMAAHAAGDVHVPEKYRLIGALSNFNAFSQEFKCAKGSAMNPNEKCEIY